MPKITPNDLTWVAPSKINILTANALLASFLKDTGSWELGVCKRVASLCIHPFPGPPHCLLFGRTKGMQACQQRTSYQALWASFSPGLVFGHALHSHHRFPWDPPFRHLSQGSSAPGPRSGGTRFGTSLVRPAPQTHSGHCPLQALPGWSPCNKCSEYPPAVCSALQKHRGLAGKAKPPLPDVLQMVESTIQH